MSKKRNLKCFVEEILFLNDNIQIKVNLLSDNNYLTNTDDLNLLLVTRNGSERIEYETTTVEHNSNNTVFTFLINSSECIHLVNKSIVDVYLINNKDTKIRVSNKVINDDSLYFYAGTNKFLKLYTTSKGNFSLDKYKDTEKWSIEDVDLDRNGELTIKGTLNYLNLGIDGNTEINFGLKVYGKAYPEVTCNATRYNCDKTMNSLTYTNIPLHNSKFAIKCNLFELGCKAKGVDNTLILVLNTPNEKIKQNIQIPLINLKVEEVIYHNGQRFYCKLTSDGNSLIARLRNRSNEIEVKALYVYEDSIKLVIDTEENFNLLNQNSQLEIFLKDRTNEIKYTFNYDINYDEGTITAYFSSIFNSTSLECGIYDLILSVDNKILKPSSINDKILTKKSCVKLPRINIVDTDGESISVLPYYTDNNYIALKVSKLLEIKEIHKVERKLNGVKITGHLYNRDLSKPEINCLAGNFILNNGSNDNIQLDFTGTFTPMSIISGNGEFDILIPKKEFSKNNISMKEFANNLHTLIDTYTINWATHSSTSPYNKENTI